jgi:hypothetical protein
MNVPSPEEESRKGDIPAFRDTFLSTFEQVLRAQLGAVRQLRAAGARSDQGVSRPQRKKGRSQIDLAQNILREAAVPLHISEILRRIKESTGQEIDSESLVSALSKRVARKERFRRTARNTFALL